MPLVPRQSPSLQLPLEWLELMLPVAEVQLSLKLRRCSLQQQRMRHELFFFGCFAVT